MKRLLTLLLAILSILTFSCKKTSNETTSTATPDYYQLKVGNYWIYQNYTIDTNGVVTAGKLFDSAHIEKDTIIRGYTYYKLWENELLLNPTQTPIYQRDSSGFLVSNLGCKVCSDNDFKDTLEIDTNNLNIFKGYVKMTGKDSVVTVPAGSFQSITCRMRVVPTQPNDPHPVRYIYDVYGKNIGRIKSHNFYYIGGQQIEIRLVRYKVNN
jgi:hypothetical protein